MINKALVFNLDDTLLRTDKTISTYAVETIKACKAKGMTIGYITGRMRPMKSEAFFIQKYGLPCDFIAYYNGALICAGDIIIERNVILYGNVMKIIRGLNGAYPNAKIGICQEPWSFLKKGCFSEGENWNLSTGEKVKCGILELPNYDVERIRIEFDEGDDINKLKSFVPENAIFFVNRDNTAMIIGKNATKERALFKASEYFNIALSDITAFGDDINDINMLKAAGIGVAMGNAADSVKEIADCVTETNDNDGIAVWINKYL